MTDLELLTGSLVGEWIGVAAYEAALGTGLLPDGAADVARLFQSHHEEHANRIIELIEERGGDIVDRKTTAEYAVIGEFPEINTAEDIFDFAIFLEGYAAAADIASLANYEEGALVVEIARIAAVEAMHLTALRSAAGMDPTPHVFFPLNES